MKIGVIGDLHFGRGGNVGIQRYEESLKEIVDEMIWKGVKVCVIVGDVFEQFAWFNAKTYMVVGSQLRRLRENLIDIYILAGNHDYDISGLFSAVEPFSDLGCQVVNKPINVIKDDCLFTFLPWITKGIAKQGGIDFKSKDVNGQIIQKMVKPVIDESEGKKGKVRIAFFHASVFGADYGSNKCVESFDFTISGDMFKGYTHVVGGHFHKRQEYNGVMYVGAMQRNTFGEKDNDCGWLMIDGSERVFIDIKSSIRFIQYDWNFVEGGEESEVNVEKLLNESAKAVSNAHVKVRYKADGDVVDRNRVDAVFRKAGALSVVVEADYGKIERARTEVSAEQDLITQFREWVKANDGIDKDGYLEKLLRKEAELGFVEQVGEDYFEKRMVVGQ